MKDLRDEIVQVIATFRADRDDRQLYEGRLKYLRDQQWRMRAAWEQGKEEGFRVGMIQALQERLGEKVTDAHDLLKRKPDKLVELLSTLEERLRPRSS